MLPTNQAGRSSTIRKDLIHGDAAGSGAVKPYDYKQNHRDKKRYGKYLHLLTVGVLSYLLILRWLVMSVALVLLLTLLQIVVGV